MSEIGQRKTKIEVKEALKSIAAEMHNKMERGVPPSMTLPVRAKTNIGFDNKLGVYKYGKKKSTRDATSLGSARQLLRSLHVTEFIEQMIDSGKSSTLREMYYISEGWGHGKFGSQNESNNLAEDLEIVTKCLREDFKLRPEEDGARIIGNVTFEERNRKGDWMKINCRDDVGDSGYGVPYNVEAEKLTLVEEDVDFIMAIETGGMFDRLVENGFDEEARCALIHLKGQPARSTRRIMKRMSQEWNKPILVFADCDILAYDLPSDELTKQDLGALDSELTDPRFNTGYWKDQINLMKEIGKKAEQQSLAKYGLDFVTDTYLPEKLADEGLNY